MASIKALVPDLAIVPRWRIISSLVMPMPVSSTVTVPASLSGVTLMQSFDSASSLEGSDAA